MHAFRHILITNQVGASGNGALMKIKKSWEVRLRTLAKDADEEKVLSVLKVGCIELSAEFKRELRPNKIGIVWEQVMSAGLEMEKAAAKAFTQVTIRK